VTDQKTERMREKPKIIEKIVAEKSQKKGKKNMEMCWCVENS
jgi:hypothetical protein